MNLWKIFTTVSVLMTVACATPANIKKETAPKKMDKFEEWNRQVLSFNEDLDDAILKPMAKGYISATTPGVEKGVTNFFSNIDDIGIAVNDLLQFKITQGSMDMSRFVVNTTAGGLGVFDVAQMIDLPKHNEDFGQTLGFWGVPSGDYLMLPFVGPSSPREAVGLLGDALLNPFNYTFIFGGGVAVSAATSSLSVLDVTNTRAGLMSTERMVNEAAAGDRYSFIRNAYQQRREYLVHDGISDESDIDLLDEDADFASNSKAKGNTTKPINKTPTTTPRSSGGLPPVINNSRHLLELSAPK